MLATRRRAARSSAQPPAPAQALREVKQQVSDLASRIREGAVETASEAQKQLRKSMRSIAKSIQQEAEGAFEDQREAAASKVAKVGKAVGQAAHALHAVKMDGVAEYIDAAAEQFERASDYIKESDLRRVSEDASEFIDRHRAVVAGGLFITGLALARFLKASGAQSQENEEKRNPDRQRKLQNNGAHARGRER